MTSPMVLPKRLGLRSAISSISIPEPPAVSIFGLRIMKAK